MCSSRNKFKQPAMLETVDPDGNCVFRLLQEQSTALEMTKNRFEIVLAHMDNHVMWGLRSVYGQAELEKCRSHRVAEKEVDCPVCGLFIGHSKDLEDSPESE